MGRGAELEPPLAETQSMDHAGRGLAPASPLEGSSRQAAAYLLVFEDHSALTFTLPPTGEVVIGRAPDVALLLGDPSASRQHASLSLRNGEVWLSDLGSRNGTRVNGERITTERLLIAGDVIGICTASLVFCRHAAIDAPSETGEGAIYTLPQLRQRLHAEIDRALRYSRSLSLLCLRIDPGLPSRAQVVERVARLLRPMNVVAWSGGCELLVLLPELSIEDAKQTAVQLREALSGLAKDCRAGLAVCPTDGSDVDTLLASAAAAAGTAEQSSAMVHAAETATTLALGERRIILVDPAMVRLYELIEKLGPSDLPVLLQGETGVGKEFAATAIHHFSRRQGAPFISINCAALPENLVESELFGHERGAFSGAVSSKPGLLEAASGGTVFFDEVGELPLPIQAKLLRVLEARCLTRVGDLRERQIDVRVVAATNRDLQAEVAAGRFRKDLFFRLSAARLTLPPLRDRRRELPVLARALLSAACERLDREALEISPAALYKLQAYSWPGNVRELRNVMDFVAATVENSTLLPWHLEDQLAGARGLSEPPPQTPSPPPHFLPIEEELRNLERQRMAEALSAAHGVHIRAAELIRMPIRTFTTKLKQYHLSSRRARSEPK